MKFYLTVVISSILESRDKRCLFSQFFSITFIKNFDIRLKSAITTVCQIDIYHPESLDVPISLHDERRIDAMAMVCLTILSLMLAIRRRRHR